MRISEKSSSLRPKRRRMRRKILTVLLLLAALTATNSLLCFLVEPYRSSSEEMWRGYAAFGNMNTVYAGTSQALSGIIPEEVDKTLGSRSYNMGTNMQSLHDSKIAIQKACSDHKISRAVLVIDLEVLGTERSANFRADESFYHAKGKIEPFPQRAADAFSFVTSDAFFGKPASLTYFMPWIYNRSTDIRLNVREKLQRKVLNPEGHRTASGFEPSKEVVNQSVHFVGWEDADAWDHTATAFHSLSLTQDNRKELLEICRFCKDHQIDLVPVVLPSLNFLNIYRVEDYLAMKETLTQLFRAEGYAYYDFNCIDPSLLSVASTQYKDVGHLNSDGAAVFSKFLGKFLLARDRGTDLSGCFVR